MIVFALTFLSSCLLGVLTTVGVIRWAIRIGALDRPCAGRTHCTAVPRLGGLAIAGSFVGGLVWLLVAAEFLSVDSHLLRQLGLLVAGGLIVLVTGLADDLRVVRARYKLAAQIVAAILVASSVRVDSLSLAGLFSVELGWVAWPVTVLWLVGMTNAMNLIDGLDGLAGGIAALVSATIFVVSLITGQLAMAVLAAAMLGSVSGFLVFNFPPARIFMGDCGSMFLGFMLSGVAILCVNRTGSSVGLLLAATAMGIAILDTVFTILRRVKNGRSPFFPDRAHVHHRLLLSGLTDRQAVGLVYGATAAAVAVGFLLFWTQGYAAMPVMGMSLLILLGVFVRAERSPAANAGVATGRETLFCLPRHADPQVEKWQLVFREARTFGNWWDGVCAVADELGFVRLSLVVTNRDGSIRNMLWQKAECDQATAFLSPPVLRVHHSRIGPPLEIESRIPIGNSPDRARRQAALLCKIVETYSLAELSRRQQLAGAA